MRNIVSRILTTLGFSFLIIGLILSTFPSQSYAKDLELIGKDIGLVVEPANERLFDLRNLNPGDTKTAKLTIKNSYKYPFNLYMRAERIGEAPEVGEADLFQVLTINVNLEDKEIYEGPIKNFAASSISLGRFSPGSSEKLTATVSLPGLETGNEYQGKFAEVKWIFIAESSKPSRDRDRKDKIVVPVHDVPKDKPEIPSEKPVEPIEEEEPIDQEEIIDIPEDEVPIDKPTIPKPKPKIPKTGELPLQLFYIPGSIMIFLGIYMNRKNKK